MESKFPLTVTSVHGSTMTSSANVEKPISHVIYIYHHIVYFHQHGCRCMTEYKLGSQADMNSSRWRSKYAVSVCVECHNEGISVCLTCGEESSHLRYSQPAVHRRWKKQQNHFHRRLFLPTEPEYCMWSGKSMNFERVQGCQGSWTASNLIHCFCHRIQDT